MLLPFDDRQRGKLEESHRMYTILLEEHAEHSGKWNSLERILLQRQLECHSKLGMPKSRQWVAAVVSLLRCMPPNSKRPGEVHTSKDIGTSDPWNSEAPLFEMLRAASLSFEKEVPVSGFAKLSVVPAKHRAINLDNQDGATLAVAVFSSLRCELAVEDVRLCLSGGKSHREQFWLTSGKTTIRPGRNELMLRTFSYAPGRYVLDVSQIRFGRIVYQYVAPKNLAANGAISSSSSSSSVADPTIITVPQDGQAIDALLEQPRRIALDQPRCADLILKTGRNILEKAVIRLTHLSDGRPFMGFGAGDVLEEDPDIGIESTEDGLGIELRNIKAEQVLTLRFPLDETPPNDGYAMPLVVDFEYLNPPVKSDDPRQIQPKRSFRKRLDLHTALPLGVNVQDFFKHGSLLSKFSISTGSAGTLRLREASLRHADEEERAVEDGYQIIVPGGVRPTVITPRQPAAYVFKLKRARKQKGGQVKGPPATGNLRLRLTYRTLHEDARMLVLRILRRVISASSSTPLPAGIQSLLEQAITSMIDDRIDIPVYALTGSIRLAQPAGVKVWYGLCESWGLPRSSATAKLVATFAQQTIKKAMLCGPEDVMGEEGDEGVETNWRVLEIPVEVPRMDIVNRVTLKLDEGPSSAPHVVGKPIGVSIFIKSTFDWGARPASEDASRAVQDGAAPVSPSASLAPASLGVKGRGAPSAAASSVGDYETDAGSVFQDAASDVTATGEGKLQTSSSTKGSDHKVTQRMCYEVQADFENWLVSGDKRSVWDLELPTTAAQDKDDQRFKVTLIPLRSGSLTMPTVAVWPLPPGPEAISSSFAHRLPGQSDREAEGDREASLRLPSCETYVANVAQRVEVYPSMGRGGGETFWMPEG